MIEKLLGKLGLSDVSSNNAVISRRRHVRHSGVQAEVVVADKVYSVRDWSMGGMFFETPPDNRLTVGDQIRVNIRFRLPHEVIDIPHQARVVRSVRRGIAAEFAPMTLEHKRQFQRVIDGFQAQSFLESQSA